MPRKKTAALTFETTADKKQAIQTLKEQIRLAKEGISQARGYIAEKTRLHVKDIKEAEKRLAEVQVAHAKATAGLQAATEAPVLVDGRTKAAKGNKAAAAPVPAPVVAKKKGRPATATIQ